MSTEEWIFAGVTTAVVTLLLYIPTHRSCMSGELETSDLKETVKETITGKKG